MPHSIHTHPGRVSRGAVSRPKNRAPWSRSGNGPAKHGIGSSKQEHREPLTAHPAHRVKELGGPVARPNKTSLWVNKPNYNKTLCFSNAPITVKEWYLQKTVGSTRLSRFKGTVAPQFYFVTWATVYLENGEKSIDLIALTRHEARHSEVKARSEFFQPWAKLLNYARRQELTVSRT